MTPSRIGAAVAAILLTSAGAHAQEPGPSAGLLAQYQAATASAEARGLAEQRGRIRADFCVQCHGEDGNSRKPYVPKLAAQNPLYLLEQFEKFSDGRRKHYVMNPLSQGFTPEDMVNLTAMYTSKAIKPAGGDATLARAGQGIYGRSCARCHGDNGRGKAGYARIAGQQPEYVALTLRGFRDGEPYRTSPLMAEAARGLSDDDIKALAAYVGSLD